MAEDFTKTVRIQRTTRVAQDDRGHNVWVGKVESVELELVSTTALLKILNSADGRMQAEIRQLAAGKADGVLARDTATGVFQIVSNEDLEKAVEITAPRDGPKRGAEIKAAPVSENTLKAADELSLVSTQILRKIIKPDDGTGDEKPKAGKKDQFGGFDPYDNN
ncbi:MAG TPA: hypothetical protein VIK49_00420 [Steroidobacteraceae bacterium]